MRFSPSEVLQAAAASGFTAEMVEKALNMLHLLNTLNTHPSLKRRWVLKGGSALNMFLFDLPRLSMDIDINYVGSLSREQMLAERPKIEQAAHAVFSREGFRIKRVPVEHAGGKWRLGYENITGQSGTLEVDMNFMLRLPLWDIRSADSHPFGDVQSKGIPVLDAHELAAGKLAALLSRRQARDLFDSHRILGMDGIDSHRLRIAFVVYGAMSRKDWRTVSAADVEFDPADVARQLMPMLRVGATAFRGVSAVDATHLMRECRERLSAVLPLTDSERAFLDLLLDRGVIDPTALTADEALAERIRSQPLLEWKALNVRRHKGLS